MEGRGANPAVQKSGEGNAVFYTPETEDWLEKNSCFLSENCPLYIIGFLEFTAERQRLTITLGNSESESGCVPWIHNYILISIYVP